jgi:hypothetical protein
MLDIPEMLIIALTALLAVLWTRHWMLHHRAGEAKKSLRDSGRELAETSKLHQSRRGRI